MNLPAFLSLMEEHGKEMKRQPEPPRVPAKLEDVMQDNMPGFEVEVNRVD